tara:strand:+ start:218 stop:385 length:168 start_codon:yes stop_codon:yes gene_type:complete
MKNYEIMYSYLSTGTIQVQASSEDEAVEMFYHHDFTIDDIKGGDYEHHDVREEEE